MPRSPISRVSPVSVAATALFLVAGASLVVIGWRLVSSERAVAEQTARESLRARLTEASGLLLGAAARLTRTEPIAVIAPGGEFAMPPEPRKLRTLEVLPGRDPEAEFYLAEAGRAEWVTDDPERAEALYFAAAADDRDLTARLIALHRLAAMAHRRANPELAARARELFRSILPESHAGSIEALVVRALVGSSPSDPELEDDILVHLGTGDDEIVFGLLRQARLFTEDAVARRRAELPLQRRLRALIANAGSGAVIAAGAITTWTTAEDGSALFFTGAVPKLPEGVTQDVNSTGASEFIRETLDVGEPFAGAALTATTPRDGIESEARRGAAFLIAALAALLAAGAAALILAMRAARRESAAAREQALFVTKVGHDLRTPLALIRMYAETIADGRVSDPGEAREFAGIAAREAERLTGLVSDVLDLSRISERNGALIRNPLDLAALAGEVAEAHRPLLARVGVELTIDALTPVRVLGDPSAIRGAVSNLLSNVARHASGGGAVAIEVALLENVAELAVSDRGPGIPEELTERVFERFVRGPDRPERGAGLGLALVREVATAHGGTTTAANREGGGAVLTITMPLAPEEND